MATLVFTALGTAIGGPLGGAIGSLIGNQLDRTVLGASKREGPRVKELAVTTSSYGSPVPRYFGTMRAAGTVIWATDLVESSEKTGGGKGAPSTTTYSYSASFAVAVSSRPILEIGRIWADGNLLRGAAGDLKVGGKLRVYRGLGDQLPDPLIAAERGGACPAFRGLAYCVFESLQLADFGNRIPTLTFEVVADASEVTLASILEPVEGEIDLHRPLPGLTGFSDEGGPVGASLSALGQVYPFACDAGGSVLSIISTEQDDAAPALLPESAVAEEDGFGSNTGHVRSRQADGAPLPTALRYYDVLRDFQPGIQRAEGRARAGRGNTIELPGAFDASSAKGLVNASSARARHSRETLSWRVAELDPAIRPGAIVKAPGYRGNWLIESWEWRESGVELELRRVRSNVPTAAAADAGESLPKIDELNGPTELVAFELPWDGQGSDDRRNAFAAVNSAAPGWTGCSLYLERDGELVPLGASGTQRSVIGRSVAELRPSAAVIIERDASVEIDLVSPLDALQSATAEQLAQGANRAIFGNEIIQFADAARIDSKRWRLTGLLRGRGGTEAAATEEQPAGTAFVLLDGSALPLDPAGVSRTDPLTIAALGLADEEPVLATVRNSGAASRPLSPVHPQAELRSDGGMMLSWVRRARGAWIWGQGVEVPLNEEAERYLVGVGALDAPDMQWSLGAPQLEIDPSVRAELIASHGGKPIWVRQLGRFNASPALLLATL